MRTVIVTGGAGFIGSALVRHLIQRGHFVVNIDKLTYAGNEESLRSVATAPCYRFERADICDGEALDRAFSRYRPEVIFHLAAESHVDRSIDGPAAFVETNVRGTFVLLQAARRYWSQLDSRGQRGFRFLHVSTDEVFGSLGETGYFSEQTAYGPRSPYSASKAASDHFVRAWHHTYGLPVLVSNCSNNYGPYQFPEKLVPVVILKALRREPIPVYGKGENVRDWLFVDDHVRGLETIWERGEIGETYAIGGNNERTNLALVQLICRLLDAMAPDPLPDGFGSLVNFVGDRPGHDLRYAIDSTKISRELGWKPIESVESGLEKTVRWYLENQEWCERITTGKYRLERLGLANATTQSTEKSSCAESDTRTNGPAFVR